jgi:hypothetical protein
MRAGRGVNAARSWNTCHEITPFFPAKAGTVLALTSKDWVPAFAGTNGK